MRRRTMNHEWTPFTLPEVQERLGKGPFVLSLVRNGVGVVSCSNKPDEAWVVDLQQWIGKADRDFIEITRRSCLKKQLRNSLRFAFRQIARQLPFEVLLPRATT